MPVLYCVFEETRKHGCFSECVTGSSCRPSKRSEVACACHYTTQSVRLAHNTTSAACSLALKEAPNKQLRW